MITQTKQQTDFIKMVANQLAKKFIQPLFELTKEKNYPAHIGGLAELLDWAREFYDLHYDKVINWEMFKLSNENIYNAVTPDDLIVAFGKERIKKFYEQNTNHAAYFLEKYAAIEL